MVIKLNLTDEHLKLIPFIFLQEGDDDSIRVEKRHMFNLGSHLLEDMSMILGYQDKAIPGTEDDECGRAFDDETESHLLGLHSYLKDNLMYIETLIHQFAVKGGLTAGTYKCKDRDLIWEKEQ
jgi:hypothetical protein